MSGAHPRAAARTPIAALGACAAVAGLLLAWAGRSYWNYSDGVYAYSARALLEGRELYADLVAAQPPPISYAGVPVLAVADSVWALRAVLALLAAATGWLVARATLRLTGHRATAVAAGVATLVTPWAIKGHLSWVPESFAAPLLLAAAGLAVAPGRGAAVAAGVLAAAAAGFKLAFALPALALLVVARRRGAMAAGLLGTLAVGAALTLAIWGGAAWDNVVVAQRQSGARGAADVARLLAEGAWNSGPVLALAALAWPLRRRLGDPRLAAALAVGAAAATGTLVTLVKDGSYHNVLVVAEPLALPLAAAAALAAVRARQGPVVLAVAACTAFLAVQSLSVLASPEDPAPLPSPGGVRIASSAEVAAEARAARACGPRPFSGTPYGAFVARRRMPGDQPDQFILASPVHRRAAEAAAADAPRCP